MIGISTQFEEAHKRKLAKAKAGLQANGVNVEHLFASAGHVAVGRLSGGRTEMLPFVYVGKEQVPTVFYYTLHLLLVVE